MEPISMNEKKFMDKTYESFKNENEIAMKVKSEDERLKIMFSS
jgi:hypothetical protein